MQGPMCKENEWDPEGWEAGLAKAGEGVLAVLMDHEGDEQPEAPLALLRKELRAAPEAHWGVAPRTWSGQRLTKSRAPWMQWSK